MSDSGSFNTESRAEEPIKLAFACTPDEVVEAQTLGIRQELGNGSTVVTRIKLFGLLALVLWIAWKGMLSRMTPIEQAGICALMIVAFCFFHLQQRRMRAAMGSMTFSLELTGRGIRVRDDEASAEWQWGGFSQRIESDNLFVFQGRTRETMVIIPKRALPSDAVAAWLRQVKVGEVERHAAPAATDSASVGTEPESGEATQTIRYHLGCRSCVDRVCASYPTRFAMLLPIVLMSYVTITSWAPPGPEDEASNLEVILVFVLPMTLVLELVLVAVFTGNAWLSHRVNRVDVTVRFGESGLSAKTVDGELRLPRSGYTRYKESPWHFFVWDHRSGIWQQIPKSAFATREAMEEFRGLLVKHLERSPWFNGA
ncbi:MAG: YcxB family protein [Planctomycetota bacterium]|nr:YcxB family protein [Planctomycetota bacterium]